MPLLAPAENDFVLLHRFSSDGDAEAFSELVKRYAGVVYAASYRVVQDRARAEDVSQEVFFRLLRRPDAVNQSLGGWLHQCATRLALDEARSESARRRREANRRLEIDGPDAGATSWTEISPHVDAALASLPDESRAMLVSHFLQGKSQSAISQETQMSPATVSRRMRDAVLALRAELKRRGVVVAPVLLVSLCRVHATVQAGSVPARLVSELGKMAIVGTSGAAKAGFVWHSVSAWCDAAAKTWGWPGEMVKQAVGAAATSAVALLAALLMAQAAVWMIHSNDPAPILSREPERRVVSIETTPPPVTRPQAVSPIAQVSTGERVEFRWPSSADEAMALVRGDGQMVTVPEPLVRRLTEAQNALTNVAAQLLADASSPPRPSDVAPFQQLLLAAEAAIHPTPEVAPRDRARNTARPERADETAAIQLELAAVGPNRVNVHLTSRAGRGSRQTLQFDRAGVQWKLLSATLN